ncbi:MULTISPECIES: GerAB/ArcD/ProY family transporter [Bacillaceae]|uniref:Spore germination protein n=1 Tax=Evansella alkalicola TaxID=745819 RepID=A0ABS6JQ98_9BACI|nr:MULTISPECIES: endospore germination permease [Bacillaceae]MBU9720610.1 spore germination protein [Bacillus alkalicola]
MKYHISNLQISALVGNYIIAATLITVPQAFIDYAMQNTWLVPLNLFLFSVIFVNFFLIGFKKLNPSTQIWDKDLLSRAISFLLLILLVHIMVRDLRIISGFTKEVLIPMTPQFIITMVFIFTIMYLAWSGIEVIARFTELYFLYFIIVVLFIPFSLITEFEFSKFEPVLSFSAFPSIFQASYIGFAWVGEIIVFILVISMVKPIKNTKKSLIIGIGVSMFLLTLLILGQVGVLGAELVRYFMYPTYSLIQQIRLTEFMDRLDLVLVAFYYPTIFAKLAFSLYGIKRCVEILFNIKTNLIILPIGLTIAILSIMFFENRIEKFNFEVITWSSLGLFLEMTIALMFVLLVYKRRKKDKPSSENQNVG